MLLLTSSILEGTVSSLIFRRDALMPQLNLVYEEEEEQSNYHYRAKKKASNYYLRIKQKIKEREFSNLIIFRQKYTWSAIRKIQKIQYFLWWIWLWW